LSLKSFGILWLELPAAWEAELLAWRVFLFFLSKSSTIWLAPHMSSFTKGKYHITNSMNQIHDQKQMAGHHP
jgi:hypothetical protein